MSGQWRDVLDTLAELGRAVLAERTDEKTRPDANVSEASASSRADSTPAHKSRARREFITDA